MPEQSSVIRQMRNELKAKSKAQRETEAENRRLRALVAASAGIPDKAARMLEAQGYEVSDDGLAAFRAEVLGTGERPDAVSKPPVPEDAPTRPTKKPVSEMTAEEREWAYENEDDEEAEATNEVATEDAAPAPRAAQLHAPTRAVGTPAQVGYTSNEIVAMMGYDPEKADRLLRSGKVKRQAFNPGGPPF